MIKKLIDKLLGKPAPGAGRKSTLGKRVEVPKAEHGIDPALVDERAVKVVSTLTESLRHLFLRLGITPLVLGAADPERLGADAQAWGRYYDHQPIELAGQQPQALQRLERRNGGAS